MQDVFLFCGWFAYTVLIAGTYSYYRYNVYLSLGNDTQNSISVLDSIYYAHIFNTDPVDPLAFMFMNTWWSSVREWMLKEVDIRIYLFYIMGLLYINVLHWGIVALQCRQMGYYVNLIVICTNIHGKDEWLHHCTHTNWTIIKTAMIHSAKE